MRRLARLDKRELADIPLQWTKRERGQYLRRLLQFKGINPNSLYQVQYFPHRHCWLLTQEVDPAPAPGSAGTHPPPQEDELFYLQALAEFRRTALAAFAAVAAQSPHFAQFGRPYQLPPEPQEMTPADLANLLGGSSEAGVPPRFDSEGGWRSAPSHS